MRTIRSAADRESGVALVTVLMIVAAMSTVAIMLSSAVLASTNRAKALDANAQADWYVTGAGAFAEVVLAELIAETGPALFAGMPMLNQPMTFEVDGGALSVTGRDATNCFNINTLRQEPAGSENELSGPREEFRNLLDVTEIDGLDAEEATAVIADWMDADRSPGLGGAEDSYYAGQTPPYRTSGQLMYSLNELRAVRSFTPELIEALAPILCAYPDETGQTFNINTLTEQQAPLLTLAMSGALSVEAARDAIFQRPPGGWESVEALMALPEFAQISPELRRTQMLSVQSSHIGVTTVIEYRGVRRIYDQLLALEENGTVETVRRERRG